MGLLERDQNWIQSRQPQAHSPIWITDVYWAEHPLDLSPNPTNGWGSGQKWRWISQHYQSHPLRRFHQASYNRLVIDPACSLPSDSRWPHPCRTILAFWDSKILFHTQTLYKKVFHIQEDSLLVSKSSSCLKTNQLVVDVCVFSPLVGCWSCTSSLGAIRTAQNGGEMAVKEQTDPTKNSSLTLLALFLNWTDPQNRNWKRVSGKHTFILQVFSQLRNDTKSRRGWGSVQWRAVIFLQRSICVLGRALSCTVRYQWGTKRVSGGGEEHQKRAESLLDACG